MEKDNIKFIDGKPYLITKASVLPTTEDNKDRLQIYRNSENKKFVIGFMNARSTKDAPHSVYITSNEKICGGDKVLLHNNWVVEAVDFIGNIGYKVSNRTAFLTFQQNDRKIITIKPSLEFIKKLIFSEIEPLNIDVLTELTGGGKEEVLLPTWDDDIKVTYNDIPYKLKQVSGGFHVIHTLKNNWNKNELYELFEKAKHDTLRMDGLYDKLPNGWVENILYQIDK